MCALDAKFFSSWGLRPHTPHAMFAKHFVALFAVFFSIGHMHTKECKWPNLFACFFISYDQLQLMLSLYSECLSRKSTCDVSVIWTGVKGIGTLFRMDTIPNGHYFEWTLFRMDTIPNGHYFEWTLFRMDAISNGHYSEWTLFQMDTIPNGHYFEWTLFRMDTIPNGHYFEWTLFRMDAIPNGRNHE